MRLAIAPFTAMTRAISSLQLMTRKPKRVTITVSHKVLDRLYQHSTEQGRSTSNLAAHLLEVALDAMEGNPRIEKRWPSQPSSSIPLG